MSRRTTPGIAAVAAWCLFVLYNVLFQLLAVGLSPQLLQVRGVVPDEIRGTVAWKAREMLMFVWRNNGYVWSGLLLLALLATVAWLHARRSRRMMDVGGGLAT